MKLTTNRAMRWGMFVLILSFSYKGKAQKTPSFDILIRHAYVFDGSGTDSAQADVGIVGERIVFVGTLAEPVNAARTIDATGLYLAPGFIDPHTHYIGQLNHEEEQERAVWRALAQGVTTVFEGNDGSSPLPIGATLERWEKNGIGPNAALFVGHNTVRKKVLGTADVQPSPQALEEMKSWVERSMEEGAFGLSTGLFYNPGNFAKTNEVVELAKVAARFGGIYDTHQRDEGSQNIGVVNSSKEVLEVGEKANIPVHFSHIKVAGPRAWGKSAEIIRLIEEAQARGVVVTANQYPYVASRTSLSAALVPAWVRDGGTPAMRRRFQQPELRDSILRGIHQSIQARTADPSQLVLASGDEALNGKSLATLANEWQVSPEEAVVRVCMEGSPSVHSFMMKEEDIERFMKQPWVMTGSDGGGGHPRAFGSFARKIREYAINRGVLSIAEAVYKSSYLTAKTVGIKDRGLIKAGYFADIVLFDRNLYDARSTYEDGEQLAVGAPYVLVNGHIVIDQGKPQRGLFGKALRLTDELVHQK